MQAVATAKQVTDNTVYLVPENSGQSVAAYRSCRGLLRRWLRPRGGSKKQIILCPLYYDPAGSDLILGRIKGRGEVRAVNGQHVRSTRMPDSGLVAFAPGPFEPWENVLWVDATVREVQLYPAFDSRSRVDLSQLRGDQQFCLENLAGMTLEPVMVTRPVNSEPSPLAFILRSLNTASGSAFKGTFYACYDLTHHTYRLNSWVWCSAVAVRALLTQRSRTGDESLYEIAVQVGEALRKRQLTTGPNAGAVEVRWDLDRSRARSYGIVRWLAPNDTAFIAAEAFLPLYEATGDPGYLQAARRVAAWIRDQGTHQSGRLRVGCDATTGKWDDSWLYVDSMFVAGLFAGLAAVDPDGGWSAVLQSTLDDAVRRFSLPNGLFAKTWRSRGERDTAKWARGQAWALLGLLDAYGAVPRKRWLDRAIQCANALLDAQNSNGSWYYIMDDPSSGECAKATPILAYSMARLFKATGSSDYWQAARRALRWCQTQIYDGADPYARGGVTSHTTEGCIVGARDVNCAFLYSAAYYLLAQCALGEVS